MSDIQGLTEFRTANGVYVARVHYTADPAKRDPAWIENEKKGTTAAAWEREMEINFNVFMGKAWYEEFRFDFHVAKEPIKPIPSRPLFRGWDYGQTFNPAVVFCQTTVFGQLLILYPEIYGLESGLHPFARAVKSESGTYFPGYQISDYGDPAGNNRSPNDEKSATDILRADYGINVLPGPVAFGTRSEAIRKLLTTTTAQGQAMLLIDPRCTWLIGAFTGGYHRKQLSSGQLLEEPDKNEYSHIMDGLGYLASSVFSTPEKTRSSKMHKAGAM